MKQIKAILLIVLLLTSQIGLAMSTHHCKMNGTDHAIKLSAAQTAHCDDMPMKMPCEEKDPHHQHPENPCCTNDVQTFQVDDDYLTQSDVKDLNPQFVLAFAFTSMLDLSLKAVNIQLAENYFPPPPERNIQVLLQNFRI